MRILQLANFYHPRSGGLRTAIDAFADGYAAAGHEVVLVVPGAARDLRRTAERTIITLRGPRLPRSGGYRTIVDQRSVQEVIRRVQPDVIELSDKTTLARMVAAMPDRPPVVMFSHERLDRVIALHVPNRLGSSGRVAQITDRWTRRLVRGVDAVVCASQFAATEVRRVGAGNICYIPLGVDLLRFQPGAADRPPEAVASMVRRRRPDVARVVYVGRLSSEKHPDDALAAFERLFEAGRRAEMIVAGDGPMRAELERAATGYPVTFAGHLVDRAAIAALIASADVAIAPSPNETFGLAALEAMACGTPVVGIEGGAVAELIVPDAGAVGRPGPNGLAAACGRLLDGRRERQPAAARARAEQFPWSRSIDSMLELFEAVRTGARSVAAAV